MLLVVFGLGFGGYLYLGRLRRAIAALAVAVLNGLASITGVGGVANTALALYAVAALQVAILIFIIVDSIRIARAEHDYVPRPYNRGWIYAVIVAVSVAISWYALRPSVRTFSIASDSMQPTLHIDDKIIVDTHALAPRRGAVIVFALPRDPRQLRQPRRGHAG